MLHLCKYVHLFVSRPKHPPKVHVWAGISLQGPTIICVFDGTIDAPLFIEIFEGTLLPFIREKFPEGHRLMQDNDPKHASRVAQDFYTVKSINWWKTPAESPDLNPIENLWHEMKEFICCSVKPHSKDELIEGILHFWKTVDVPKCTRFDCCLCVHGNKNEQALHLQLASKRNYTCTFP